MATAQHKKKVIAAMDNLPEKKVLEVLDFVSYLKLREDKCSRMCLLPALQRG